MKFMRRKWRGPVSVPTALLMLALGVTLPILERADLSASPVVESEHEPGSCPAPHDHTVCTQVSANHAAPSGAVRALAAYARSAEPAAPGGQEARAGEAGFTAPARAPPTV